LDGTEDELVSDKTPQVEDQEEEEEEEDLEQEAKDLDSHDDVEDMGPVEDIDSDPYTSYSARMSPDNFHKLMGIYMGSLILCTALILCTGFSAF
jgi:hypothetical protein